VKKFSGKKKSGQLQRNSKNSGKLQKLKFLYAFSGNFVWKMTGHFAIVYFDLSSVAICHYIFWFYFNAL
jgi:hypothetical protein